MTRSPSWRLAVAILIGILTVFLVQAGLTLLWKANGITWGPKNLPYAPLPQVGALSSAFIAGIMGPFVAVLIARRTALVLWVVFLGIGLAIDGFAALGPMQPLPMWFRVSWVSSVVFQVAIGITLGSSFLKKKATP